MSSTLSNGSLHELIPENASKNGDIKKYEVFQEIFKNIIRCTIGNERKLELNHYLMRAFELKDSDVDENDDSKSCKTVDSYLVYRKLMIILLQYEMFQETWKGDLSELSNEILSLYAKKKSLADFFIFYSRWIAFARVYQPSYINVQIFEDLVDKINDQFDPIETKLSCTSSIPIKSNKNKRKKSKKNSQQYDEFLNDFWNENELLLQTFAVIVLRKLNICTQTIEEKEELITINLPDIFEFIKTLDQIVIKQSGESKFTKILHEELLRVKTDYLQKCFKNNMLNQASEDDVDELRLEVMICGIKFCTSDFNETVEKLSPVLQNFPNDSLVENLFENYCKELKRIIKPIILDISQRLKQKAKAKTVMSTIKLYKNLEDFVEMGIKKYNKSYFTTNECLEWFPGQISAIVNTPLRISKAIEKESKFNDHNHTTSAVDFMGLIYAVIKFWDQFDKTGENEIYISEFIADDSLRFALDYIDKYTLKIEAEEKNEENYCNVLIKMSIAVANFQYILSEMQNWMSNFLHNAIKQINDIFKQNFESIQNKITKFIKDTMERFMPIFIKWMTEAATLKEKTQSFLFDVFKIMNAFKENMRLTQAMEATTIFWNGIIQSLPIIAQNAVEDNELKDFFENLSLMWQKLKEIFGLQIESDEMKNCVSKFEECTDWYGLDTQQLLRRQYKSYEGAVIAAPTATVECSFVENKLIISVLHAQKLDLLVTTGKCNTFIRVKLFNEDLLTSAGVLKTKVQKDNHFPLFEECFEIELTEEQKSLKSTLIYFKLKRELSFGTSETLGEAFLSFGEIPTLDGVNNQPLRREITFLKLNYNDDHLSMRIIKKRNVQMNEGTRKLLTSIELRDKPIHERFIARNRISLRRMLTLSRNHASAFMSNLRTTIK